MGLIFFSWESGSWLSFLFCVLFHLPCLLDCIDALFCLFHYKTNGKIIFNLNSYQMCLGCELDKEVGDWRSFVCFANQILASTERKDAAYDGTSEEGVKPRKDTLTTN